MEQSDGIKRAHNGTIGESRTKSFLIDRFWVLERSADIDGADFIIQRKLKGQSILNDKPPRFGIIQSKFSQNKNTTHKLKKDYVVDKKGNPHLEFFLIINVGFEDSQEMCLLSANEIIQENFTINEKNEFEIYTNKIIQKFKIKKRKRCLDSIENSLKCVEFYKNRMYVFSSINTAKPDLSAIHPDYKIEIDYVDGNIPDLFREQKVKAYDFMLEIEKIHKQLLEFIQEVSPLESTYIAEIFNKDHSGNLEIPQIFDENFYFKAKRYLEQIDNLKNDGILENYLDLKNIINDKVNSYLSTHTSKIDSTSQHIIYIKYNKHNLSNLEVNNNIISNDCSLDEYSKFLYLEEGKIEIAINIGVHITDDNLMRNLNECCLIDIMEKIYELKYFEN